MRPFPLILCAALTGVLAGWYSGGAARTEKATTAARTPGAENTPPAARSSVAQLNAFQVKARIDSIMASTTRDATELQLLMARWVAADLEGAKEWMHAHYGDAADARESGGAEPLTAFFGAWAALDPAAAMEEVQKFKGRMGETATAAIMVSLSRADASTITAALLKMKPSPPTSPDSSGVGDLLRQLTARDPEAAKTLALQLQGSVGAAAVVGVAEAWARTDPKGALAWAEQNGTKDPRQRAVTGVLTEWAKQDPLAAGPFLLKKTPGQPDRFCTQAAAEAMARLAESNAGEALAFAGKYIPSSQLKSGLTDFYYRLCAQNSESPTIASLMCQLVGTLPPESLKDLSLFKGGQPANEVLQSTWDQLQQVPDSPARTFMLGQLGQKLLTNDVEPFLAAVGKMPDEKLREAVLEQAFGSPARFVFHPDEDWQTHFQSLTAAVENLPEKVREQAAHKLAWSAYPGDLQATVDIIAKYPDIANKDNLALNVARQFVSSADANTALTWAATLPEAARISAYGGIVSEWYEQDSQAASRWVDGLPPGPERDGAADALAAETFSDDPDAAFAWASSVKDDNRRTESTKRVASNWARFDWQAASMAIQASSLSAEQKDSLQSLISQRR